ncbi:MAG TPA: hypothetical protein VE964_09035 [Myxococcales bacterium]|nr:hypothetical protein [Myxococcales bacterium]
MRHTALFLGTLSLAACISDSQQARPAAPAAIPAPAPGPDRSQQTLRDIDQQRRWTAEALAGRPPADELEAARDGDPEAIADSRKRLRRLLTAVERTTWIREAVPEVLRASPEQDRLVATFDGAAQDRNEALGAAEAAAHALAGSRSRGAISLEELRHGLMTARSARVSEQRLAVNLGHAARGGSPNDPLRRLTTVPMPPNPPFVQATARYIAAHPAEDRAMDAWPPQLSEERTQIRAAVADLQLPPGVPDAGIVTPQAAEAGQEGEPIISGTDTIPPEPTADASAGAAAAPVVVSGDLKNMLSKRGPPLSIAQRPDGLTAFRYHETRPCGTTRCDVSVDYLFDSQGRLMRSEVAKP